MVLHSLHLHKGQVVGGAANHPAEDAGVMVHPVHVEPGLVVVLHGDPAHWEPGLLLQVQTHQIPSLLTVEADHVLSVSVEVNQHTNWVLIL